MSRWIRDTNGAAALACLLTLSLFALGCPAKNSSNLTELVSVDVVIGDGDEAVNGKNAVVHYIGWVFDGSKDDHKGAKFDSSRDRGLPFAFTLGKPGVIEGWAKGVLGMKAGGVRVLTIPAAMAYGDEEAAGGRIPANSALVFEIELLRVRG